MTFDYLEPFRLLAKAFGYAGRGAAWVLIWGYRLLLRPLFPATCRFEPSCSEYALIAVGRFGALRGGWLALRRLLRCNPWGPWGHDPVPDCTSHSHSHSIRIGYRREHP